MNTPNSGGSQRNLKDWAGNNKFKRFLISGYGVAFISLLIIAPFAIYQRQRSEQVKPMVNRATHDKLISGNLIDSELEDDFFAKCEEHTLPKVGGDRQKMANTCACTYEAVAKVALSENKRFSTVLGEIAEGKREDLSCEYVN